MKPKYRSPLDKWMTLADVSVTELSGNTKTNRNYLWQIRRGQGGGLKQEKLSVVANYLADRIEGATVGDVLTGLVCPEADDWCPPVGGET